MHRQWTSLCPGESPFKIRLSLLPANYKHCTPRATIFPSGSPSSPLPLPNHSLQSNSSKDLPILLPLPTQAEHTHATDWLPFSSSSRATHTHSHCAVSSTAPSASLVHTPPPIHHPLFLTHHLPYSGRNIYPNRSSEWASKGKVKMCPLLDRYHGDSKQQQLESQDIYLDHHCIDILVLIFTHTFCLCQQ